MRVDICSTAYTQSLQVDMKISDYAFTCTCHACHMHDMYMFIPGIVLCTCIMFM